MYSHCTCCRLRDFGGQENLLKIQVQITQKRHQNWSIKRPRYDLLRLWWISASLCFLCFWGAGKRRAQKSPNISLLVVRNRVTGSKKERKGDYRENVIIQWGHLSSGSGHFGWFYIPLFDNTWHRPELADFGAHWIVKGSPNRTFSHKIKIRS